MAAKKEFDSTRDAINLFSNQFYAVVDHVRIKSVEFIKKKIFAVSSRKSPELEPKLLPLFYSNVSRGWTPH